MITREGVDITNVRAVVSRAIADNPEMTSDLRVSAEHFPFLKPGVVLLSPRGAEVVTGRGPSTIRKYMAQGLKSYRFLGARVIALKDLQHFMNNVLKEPGRPRNVQV